MVSKLIMENDMQIKNDIHLVYFYIYRHNIAKLKLYAVAQISLRWGKHNSIPSPIMIRPKALLVAYAVRPVLDTVVEDGRLGGTKV